MRKCIKPTEKPRESMTTIENIGKNDAVVVTMDEDPDMENRDVDHSVDRKRLEERLEHEKALFADSQRSLKIAREAGALARERLSKYEQFVDESGLRGAYEEFWRKKEEEAAEARAALERERQAEAARMRQEYFKSNTTAQSILAEMRRRREQGN